MADESTFGKPAEGLQGLFSIGADGLIDEDKDTAPSLEALDLMIEKPGSKIDGYRLLRILGEGGMGIVFLAQQEEPVRRQVALKVIKPGMDSKRVISRFEAEKQALAVMQHPHIAGVYDAGLTPTGRPYFVMEYVKGLPVTDYCDQHKLSIKERLNLFVQVCKAVQHAHQKGIIHRDIKPSNILISPQDDTVVPKIIDFGVAKAIGKSLTERSLATEDTQLLGTPEYMSPEQADMATEDIDTRSDIYSLGVLLYVLLTGVLPFDSDMLRIGGIEKIRKTIRETDPKTPSTRLTSLGEDAEKVAETRSTEIVTLTKYLKNELEWIPLKAMRKERTERYRSALELADDIENYLNGIPLIAGPLTTIYRLKKFVRRNRVLSAAFLAVAVTLFLGLAATTAMYIRSQRALGKAEAIANFFTKDVFGNIRDANSNELTVAYLLDTSSNKIQGKFEDPLVEANVRFTFGGTYQSMGKYEPARQLLHRAYQIRLKHLGPEKMDTIMAANQLCWSHLHGDRYEEALELWNQQLDIIRRLYGEEHHRAVLFMNNIGSIYTLLGRYKEADRVLSKALEINGRVFKLPYFLVIGTRNLAQNYLEQGYYAKAEQLCLEIIQPEPLQIKVKNLRSVDCIALLGEIYRAQGRYREAERMLVESLNDEKDMARKMERLTGLAKVYVCQRDFAKAEELYKNAIELGPKILPGKSCRLLSAMNGMAELRTKQENFIEAERLFQQVLDGRKEKLGDCHPKTLETINDFGVLRREQQRYEEAESMLRQALNGRRLKLGDDHPACFESMHELAELCKEQARYEEAERLLLEAIEGRRLKLGDTHPHSQESAKSLIELYEAWGKPERTGSLKSKMSNP